MKKITKYWMMACMYAFILLIACETTPEDVVPDDDDPILIDDDPPIDELDANEVSDLLIFENATSMSGNIPVSSNLLDLKMDKDTIYLVEGYKNRIQILSPETFGSGISTYVQVKDSDKYSDVIPAEGETTDSVFAFYMEIDPKDMELPINFTVIFAVHESGSLMDRFEKEVVVEKKAKNSCSPVLPSQNWFWLWTTIDGNIFSLPGVPIRQEGIVNGCCDELTGISIDCIANGIPESKWIAMEYENYLLTNMEYLSFKEDGFMLGELVAQTRNIDPSESDFCKSSPEYLRTIKFNKFWGDYTYNSSTNKLSFTSIEARTSEVYLPGYDLTVTEYDRYYISTFFEYEIISCHFMVERSNLEGSTRERMFERKFGTGVDTEDEYKFFWYD